jgi:hypothetical protein
LASATGAGYVRFRASSLGECCCGNRRGGRWCITARRSFYQNPGKCADCHKAETAVYQKSQDTLNKIQANAHAALDAIRGQMPEAVALLVQTTDSNARKLVAAVEGKDLAAQVGSLLPAKNTYK